MASFGIRDIYNVELDINGYSLLSDPFQMRSIQVRSHIHMDLPSLTLNFIDRGGEYLDNNVGQDNAPADISISTPEGNYSGNFMLMGAPRISETQNLELEQYAVLNKPGWFKIIDKHFPNMPSSEVLSQVASMAGLQPIVDATNDVMTWLPNNTPLKNYARFISQRGYSGDSTALLTAVTETGKFLYKDLQKLVSSGTKFKIGFGEGMAPYKHWKLMDKSPIYNSARGYGATTAFPTAEGPLKELNTITSTLLGNAVNVGKAIKGAIGDLGIRIESMPLSAGNIHENYQKAIHQNQRAKSMFGFDVQVLIEQFSGTDLLDIVEFEPINKKTLKPFQAYSGPYMLTGKVMIIQDMRFYELLTLTREGPQE